MYIPALPGHEATRPGASEFFNEVLLKKRFLLREDRVEHDPGDARREDLAIIYRTPSGITS